MTTMLRWPGAKRYGAVARAFSTLLVALMIGGLPQFLIAAPAAAANEPTAFTNVRLWIYPEYDDPRLLIILGGSLPQGAKVPATVRFLVPKGAQMYSAGSIDTKDNYSKGYAEGNPQGHDRKPSDIADWDEISYQLTTNVFRVEYYVDSIKGLPDKTIDYEFRTLYPLDVLEVDVLQPAKATNFSATPEWQSKGAGENNMAVYRYRYTNVGVDKPLSFNFRYTKADNVPSIEPQQQAGSAATQSSSPNMIWVLGIAGAGVIAGVAFWYASSQRRYRPALYRSTRLAARSAPSRVSFSQVSQRPSRSERAAQDAGARAAFCRKCGARLEGTARFCKRCGTRVG